MAGGASAAAREIVAAVRDDPARRLDFAGRFYDDRPGRPRIRAYRRAELAFMHWQISRGVLGPPGAQQPGSPWWRAVNEGLLRDACEADHLVAGAPGRASRPAVSHWVRFLRQPSAAAWYRAHNASIVAGYLEHRPLSAAELPIERFFMDVALARVFYAQALVVSPRLALGRMRAGGRVLGDPRWRGADLFLSLHNILPVRYPLTGISIDEILTMENHAGRLLDYGVIVPKLAGLYRFAAADLGEPRVTGLIRDGFPVYAWAYEDRQAWVIARARRTRLLLAWLTSG